MISVWILIWISSLICFFARQCKCFVCMFDWVLFINVEHIYIWILNISLAYGLQDSVSIFFVYWFGSCMCRKDDTIGQLRHILEVQCNTKIPLLEPSTTIPQQLLVFKQAMLSQVLGCVKIQYCKNHHCKILK